MILHSYRWAVLVFAMTAIFATPGLAERTNVENGAAFTTSRGTANPSDDALPTNGYPGSERFQEQDDARESRELEQKRARRVIPQEREKTAAEKFFSRPFLTVGDALDERQ
ncbi:MAG: hypothetical protein RRA32_10935, partial [bacterium]|nr:hypothetical protein [bacterium]